MLDMHPELVFLRNILLAQRLNEYGFLFQPDNTIASDGGIFSLRNTENLGNNVKKIHITKCNDHRVISNYWYPYVHGAAGSISVPKNIPDGTLILTGGMNGCALHVEDGGDHYVFFHDLNGRYCKRGLKTICRVEYRDYAGRIGISGIGHGVHMAQCKYGTEKTQRTYTENSNICLKVNGTINVYSSGVISYDEGDHRRRIHHPYQSSLFQIITSFR